MLILWVLPILPPGFTYLASLSARPHGPSPLLLPMAILELNHLGKPHSWSLSVAGPPLLGILGRTLHQLYLSSPQLQLQTFGPLLNSQPSLPADHLTSCLLGGKAESANMNDFNFLTPTCRLTFPLTFPPASSQTRYPSSWAGEDFPS